MTTNIYQYRILILDFGSQYSQLIARRIRNIGVYCELLKWNLSTQQIKNFKPNGIILSGGPQRSMEHNSPRVQEYVFQAGIPVLGICYGMHIMSIQLGGKVNISNIREFGYTKVYIKESCKLLHNIYDKININGQQLLNVWMSHNDIITIIPDNFKNIASTDNCKFAIIANDEKKFYGLQFHPEVTNTSQGNAILQRFVLDICNCKINWTSKKIIKNTIKYLKTKIKYDQVILALSGGIDSTVTALLLHYAIGKQLICVFIDNGLLKLNESQEVITILKTQFDIKIIEISAEKRFLNALTGIIDPELKRKIIGKTFFEIFNEEANKQIQVKWLAQGTIYPDIIESNIFSTHRNQIIKSHHNVGGLPKTLPLKLIEPLKELFKDEVRQIGKILGIPYNILHRHPFPGPGLGVRILGEIKKEYCDILRKADSILIEELYKANLYYTVSQAFTIFLPIRSVGIMGDCRTYDWVITLRAVTTIDFMTANWAQLPYDFLNKVSNRIINEIIGITRVVYDVTSKPPSTIEWE